MAAGDPILDLSDLINLATGAGSPEIINIFKDALIAGAAPGTLVSGRMTSLWRYQGCPSAASAVPTASAACTNSTDGALKQTTSAAGTRKRLIAMAMCASIAGTVVLYDRLNHQAGLSGTATGAQTTNLPTAALTRHTNGVGVEGWLEIWSQTGATGTTITASYTNTASTSGQTTQATTWGGTGYREQDRIVILPVAVGDRGMKSIESVNAVASTTTAGNFGVTMAYPLVALPLTLAGAGRIWSSILMAGGPLDLGVASDACLALAWFPNSATAPQLFGQAFFCEK